GTTIAAGTLQIGDGGTSGSIAGNVLDNGVLAFNRSNAAFFAGQVSGSGVLRQIGTGALTLSGINTHSGGTSVTAGTLVVASDVNLGGASAALTLNTGTLLTSAAITSSRPV